MPYVLGIDVGSSDCKVIAIDSSGTMVATGRQSYPTQTPRPGWVEQDPEDWYRVACTTVRQCVAALDARQIVGLSVDGPAHNVALMDADGQVIYPTLHWSDLRSIPQAERLSAHARRIFELSYSQVNPSWTLTQLLWLKENEPDVWARLRRLLVTKDYVRYRLTGRYQTDVYDAIGTQLYDVEADQWSSELCDLIGFDPANLPPVAPAGSVSGLLLPEAAQAMGLPPGIPVAVGSGDSVVEAFGIGAVQPGQCLVKIGTAANVNLVAARPMPSPQVITYRHVVADRWFTISATNSGASTMRWFRETFCAHEEQQALAAGVSVYELINQLAEDVRPGADGLLFHPYLKGERTPHWNPTLRGNFVGIGATHTLHHFARAVMEGVAYSLRDCHETVRALGQPIERSYLIGGGARSRLWCQIIADVLGTPLLKPAVEDAAFGAAMLAGVTVGLFANWEQAVAQCAKIDATFEPDARRHALYSAYFDIYRAVTKDLQVHDLALTRLAANPPSI